MPESLPVRQRDTFRAIEAYWREHGVAPAIADLAIDLGVSRPTAHSHVRALQRKGYIAGREGIPRSWRPRGRAIQVPILAQVASRDAAFGEEHVVGWVSVDRRRDDEGLFALRVRGDSMVDGGILGGDLVVVRPGTAGDEDIVVAILAHGEPTVRMLKRSEGRVHLVAMNPEYEPVVVEGLVRVVGTVIGVRRSLDDDEAR